MNDLALVRRNDGDFDLSLENGDLQLCKTLESAVLISIGSDARAAGKEFKNKFQDDGWWGESTFEGDKWGSRLYTLMKMRNAPNILLLAKNYVEESLNWLIEDGTVSSIDVETAKTEEALVISVILASGENIETYNYELSWNEVA